MRFSTLSAIATFAVTALAQDLSAIPQCAISCVGGGLAGTGCSSLDVKCICNSSTWISELSCCVSKACQPNDQAAVISFASQICGPVGVTVPSVAGCSGSASPSATAAPSSTGAVESAAASGSAAVSSIAASVSSAAGSATAMSNAGSAPTAFAGLMAAGLLAAAL